MNFLEAVEQVKNRRFEHIWWFRPVGWKCEALTFVKGKVCYVPTNKGGIPYTLSDYEILGEWEVLSMVDICNENE